MNRPAPVFIAAPPRSGTSLMGVILHHHGFWVGRAGSTKYPKTNMKLGVENLDIKKVMKKRAKEIEYKNWKTPLPNRLLSNSFQDEVERILDKNEVTDRWLVKTSWTLTFCWDWLLYYPDALWLLPRRPIEDVVRSMKRHPAMAKAHKKEEMAAFAKALQERQNAVSEVAGNSCFVDMDRFISDEWYAAGMVAKTGVFPDMQIIRSIIDKGRWHGSN